VTRRWTASPLVPRTLDGAKLARRLALDGAAPPAFAARTHFNPDRPSPRCPALGFALELDMLAAVGKRLPAPASRLVVPGRIDANRPRA